MAKHLKGTGDDSFLFNQTHNTMSYNEYKIQDLGFNEDLSEFRSSQKLESLIVGRVALEHKDRYLILSERGEMECELIGNLRYTAQDKSDLPAVGDWVAINEYDVGKGLIHAIYPRKNELQRQAVGRYGEIQIIATNIDFGIIVQSVNRDYSLNRLERYITICHTAKIDPIIVLNKIDLIEQEHLESLLGEIGNRVKGVIVLAVSNLTGKGLEQVKALMQPGKTYCMLGSSGVGKSTLINSISGETIMKTGEISETIDRGKHVTTHRELIVLEAGGIIIDNPGMREVGLADSSAGLELTFEEIYELANKCKFNDCSHVNEKGCAVISAVESGDLSEEMYEHFMKLEREQAHFTATVHEKRRKEKAFGKMVKQVMKEKSTYKR